MRIGKLESKREEFVDQLSKWSKHVVMVELHQLLIDILDIVEQTDCEDVVLEALKPIEKYLKQS